MAIIPVDSSHSQQALQNAAQQMRTVINWANDTYGSLNQNLSTAAQMSAAGYTAAADQNAITAFIGDLNRLCQLTSGTLPASATDMRFDLRSILGVL